MVEGVALVPIRGWTSPELPIEIKIIRAIVALPVSEPAFTEVPLAEELEAYEVEILDGVTVKRVLSTATTSVVYPSAQQATDWGALLGPGDSLTIWWLRIVLPVVLVAVVTIPLADSAFSMSSLIPVAITAAVLLVAAIAAAVGIPAKRTRVETARS